MAQNQSQRSIFTTGWLKPIRTAHINVRCSETIRQLILIDTDHVIMYEMGLL